MATAATGTLKDSQPGKSSSIALEDTYFSTGERERFKSNFKRPIVQKVKPALVYDEPPENATKWRLRSTMSELPANINKTGLVNMRLSGSAAISTCQQIASIQKLAGGHPVVVVDLRKEPHASINNYSMTWTIPGNWLNINKPYLDAIQNEQKRINKLKALDCEQLTLVNHVDYKLQVPKPRTVKVTRPLTLLSEKEIVEQSGAQYMRLGVCDHLRPDDVEVNNFIQIIRDLPAKSWLHVHCKGGQGRTTTFMTLFDVLHNAQSVAIDDIIKRQCALGYNYDLVGPGNHPEREEFRKERLEFIYAFYQYARENPSGCPLLWSDWCATRAESSAFVQVTKCSN
jgi:protein-tyrosine phosphatase